jgi:hypothetical protein
MYETQEFQKSVHKKFYNENLFKVTTMSTHIEMDNVMSSELLFYMSNNPKKKEKVITARKDKFLSQKHTYGNTLHLRNDNIL